MKAIDILAILVVISIILIPVWIFFIEPSLNLYSTDFNYKADLISRDNFYDKEKNTFTGEILTDSSLNYEIVDQKNNILIIKNSFDVKKPNGDKVISINRLYGIDQKNGKHISKYGDKNRNGYLFSPNNLEKEDFNYWHVNYDNPINMKFMSEEEISGLKVYRYESEFQADQTKDLTNLPNVGKSLGIVLDVSLITWVEPYSGHLVKYEDNAIAYYYNLKTKQKLYPWNKFRNTFTFDSTVKHIREAQQEKEDIIIEEKIIPIILIIISLSSLLALIIGNKLLSKIRNK